MADSRATVRRYLTGHRAVEARRRSIDEAAGALPQQAVAECLDALEILERAGKWPGRRDELNEREAASVRRRWASLKRGYRSAAKT